MSHLSLSRNISSDIRLPSISTLAQQSNIRLPELSVPKDSNISLPGLSSEYKEVAASLVQLSNSQRILPKPIISSRSQELNQPHGSLKLRSNSTAPIIGERLSPSAQHQQFPTPPQQQQQMAPHSPQQHVLHQQYPPQHQMPVQQIPPQQLQGNYASPPPSARVYYSSPPPVPAAPVQQQQHVPAYHYDQAPMMMNGMPRTRNDSLSISSSGSNNSNSSNGKSQLSCQRCGTTETPEWRRGPNGARTLCNACGLYHAKLVKKKGALAAAEEMKFKKIKTSRTNSRNRGMLSNVAAQSQDGHLVLSKYHLESLHHHLQQQQQQHHIPSPQMQLPPPPPPPQHGYPLQQQHQQQAPMPMQHHHQMAYLPTPPPLYQTHH